MSVPSELEASIRSETPPITQSVLNIMAKELQELQASAVSTGSTNVENISRPNWGFFKDDRLIPDFDPQGELNINSWLDKINQYAHLYHWDQVTITYLALGKLKGLARVWYDSLKDNQFNWAQWQEMLKSTFPTKEKFSKLFYDAAVYSSQPGQDLSTYCFLKLSKLNKLRLSFSDHQIVDCIIAGITDKTIQLTVRAANCKSFIELTEFVASLPATSTFNFSLSEPSTSKAYSYQKRKFETSFNNANHFVHNKKQKIKNGCFSCGEVGHKRFECPQNNSGNKKDKIKCNYCHKLGHLENVCRSKQKHINLISKTEVKSIYIKRAKINKHSVESFIDLGSDSTLIRESIARKINLSQQDLSETIKLYAFNGENYVIPSFESWVDITVDGVTVNTHLFIVKDTEIRHDLLIGQSFTENKSLILIKTKYSLSFFQLPKYDSSTLDTCRFIKSVDSIILYKQKADTNLDNFRCGDISFNDRNKLGTLLNEFRDCFCFDLSELGKTNSIELKIECITEKPIVYRPYRLSIS